MIIDIKIDTEDLAQEMFEDESTDIADNLKKMIVNDAVRQLKSKMQKQIDEEIVKKIDEIMDVEINNLVEATTSKAIDEGIIVKNGTEVLLTDHIRDMFIKNTGWSSPISKMEKLAKDFGNDMKNQYNTIFASKIVENMKNQGMLKDDVAKILLGEK